MPLRPPCTMPRARLCAGLGLAAAPMVAWAPGPALAAGPDGIAPLLDGMLAPLGISLAGLAPGAILAMLAGAGLLAGLLLGLLAGALFLRRPAARPAAEAPVSQALAETRAAALEEALARERLAEERRRNSLHAFAHDFAGAMGGALDSIGTTTEQLREAAGQVAAHAEMAHDALRDTAQEVAATAGQLDAFTTRGAQLAEALHGLTDTLQAVGVALAEDAPAPARAPAVEGGAPPLPELAGDIALALDAMLATAHHVGAALTDTAAQLAEIARSAGASGEAARAALEASGTVANDCTQMTLEFATFLDCIERAGDRRQFDRYPTKLEATLLVGAERRAVRIVDISRGGCALAGELDLPLGAPADVLLPGLAATVPARVARIGQGSTGLMFRTHDPLAGVLEMLIVDRRSAA